MLDEVYIGAATNIQWTRKALVEVMHRRKAAKDDGKKRPVQMMKQARSPESSKILEMVIRKKMTQGSKEWPRRRLFDIDKKNEMDTDKEGRLKDTLADVRLEDEETDGKKNDHFEVVTGKENQGLENKWSGNNGMHRNEDEPGNVKECQDELTK